MKRHVSLFLLSGLCAACAPMATRGDLDIYDAGLRDACAHYDQTMVAPRPALRFASGPTVHDCREYLAHRRTTEIDEAVNNRIVAQDYLVCDSVPLLRQAAPLGNAGYRPESYGLELLHRLDLRGFPSSLGPMIDDRHFTLADLAAAPARVEAHAVTVGTADWRYRLEVVADVVTAAGEHDWLVWFSDEAKNGNYRSYEPLVVREPGPTGQLAARVLR